MSKYWNNRVKNITPYVPGEQPRDRKFIKLNTNENPYPPSPKVIKAIQETANESLRLYPDPQCTEFREAVAGRYGVKSEQVFAGNGSDEILAFAFAAFFESSGPNRSEPILFPDITYSFYPVYADLWDIPYRTVPVREDFSINIADYKTPSGGVVFPNPNAPTGVPISLNDVFSLAEYLEKLDKVLIVDEAYAAFGAESAVPFINKHGNILTVHTLSKSASLAGLRGGYAIGNGELIEGLCRVRDSFNSYTVDRLALAGATAAVTDAAYYNEINRRVIATRERVTKNLRGQGFTVLPSAANFVFVKAPIKTKTSVDKTEPCISGADLMAALREKGILVRHFNKNKVADYLRVSIGTDEEMDAFLAACAAIIGNIGNTK